MLHCPIIKGAFKQLQILHTHTLHLLYLTHVEIENKALQFNKQAALQFGGIY